MASAASFQAFKTSTGFSAANNAATTFFSTNTGPKFSEYRSRVMLGNLPDDFLRVHFPQPMGYNMRPGYPYMSQQQIIQNPNFLGYFTLTIAEAKLVKNSGLLGFMKMDPYVGFRIGHVMYETATATGGGKNPQWKASYRINLFKGMDTIHLEVYDQRSFTEDSFLGECDVKIPQEVMEGQVYQHWYPLMGRHLNANENQGDILIIMHFTAISSSNPTAGANVTVHPVLPAAPTNVTEVHAEQQQHHPSTPQHSSSVIPKPPPPLYTETDVQTIQEMFPTVDRLIIKELFDKNGGNKDLVVNHLLQNLI